jgi:nitroreductase
MNAIECIETRMSIRQFKPEPVPKGILMEVINTAKWSPSYKNSQPWELTVLSGEKKEILTNMLLKLMDSGARPCPDIPEAKSWPVAEAARIDQLFRKRAEIMGRSLNDPEELKEARKRNFRFYGAPHVIYIYQDAALSPWSLFDLGLFTQSLMLSAHSKGLGTVAQAFTTEYAQNIKRFLSIPKTKRLIIGVPIGYPDMGFPENRFRSDRVETNEIVKWVE